MKRVLAFVRSILPRDLTQLVFLFGCLLLYISPHLRCWPEEWSGLVAHIGPIIYGQAVSPAADAMVSWIKVLWWCQFLMFVSGSAGIFLWLLPTQRPVRNVLLYVCMPGCWAIAVICGRFLYFAWTMSHPLLQVAHSKAHFVAWAFATLFDLGPGLRFAVLGMLCMAFFLSRLWFGLTSLPASLPKSSILSSNDDADWNRVWVFVWFSMTCVFIAYAVGELPNLWIALHLDKPRVVEGPLIWLVTSISALGGAVFAGLAAWTIGKGRWSELGRFVQMPPVNYVAVAFLIVAVQWTYSLTCAYIPDRFDWWHGSPVFIEFSRWWLPERLRQIHAYYLVYIFPAAFFEEVVFRGYLQPRFVRRYGILRGLVIVGLIWSAYHFYWDFSSYQSEADVMVTLFRRFAQCETMGLALGWLSLRSGSILPSSVVHGAYNFYVTSIIDQHPPLGIVSELFFWTFVAYLLFRYWPPSPAGRLPEAQISGVPEPSS